MFTMDKVLVSYAILDYLSEKNQDIVDAYIPLVGTVILQHELEYFDRDKVREYFVADYGLTSITLGAIESILRRMCSQKMLKRENGSYSIGSTNLASIPYSRLDESMARSFSVIVKSICEFARKEYSIELTNDDIENGVFQFLDGYNVDLVLNTEAFSVKLANVGSQKVNLKYILSKFILNAYQSGDNFDFLLKLAKGHLMSQIITLESLSSYNGKMSNVVVALDAPVIYNLLGLNNKSSQVLVEELLGLLQKQQAKFVMFRHNYDEVIGTLQDAANRLKTRDYDLDKSSRVLVYAVENHLDSNFIQLQISRVSSLFTKWDVSIEEAPDSQNGYEEIDEKLLDEKIKAIYNHHGKTHLPRYVEDLIDVDVQSLSYIFRLRGNDVATSLKNCKALLLTTNNAIAYASSDKDISQVKHLIPVCVTDVFLSTIIWIAFPQRNEQLNKMSVLSLCANNVNIDNVILSRYYKKIEKLLSDGKLTEEQVAELTMNNAAMNLLEKKTMNANELFTDETPMEILYNIENQYKNKITAFEQNDVLREMRYRKIANILGRTLYWLIWFLLFLLFVCKAVWGSFTVGCTWIDCLLCIIGVFIGVWGIMNWGGIIPSRKEIVDMLSNKFYELIKNSIEGK